MTAAAFETAEPCDVAPDLDGRGAHVWLVDLDLSESAREALAPLLTEEDRQRAAAFAFPELGARHLAAHGQMRRVLAAYAGRPAHGLKFRTGPGGKPFLAPGDGPAFNLSHSDGLGLLAVSQSAPVGADIERIRRSADLGEIARASFSARESLALSRFPKDRQTEAFFACWTRKEAVVKYDGRGLGLDLASFTVPVSPDCAVGRVALDRDRAVTVFDLPVPDGYRGAVACPPQILRLRFFRLPARCRAC